MGKVYTFGMAPPRKWFLTLGGTVILIAITFQIPQWLHSIDPRSQGLPVVLNSDEYQYLARVEEALQGRPRMSEEAFVGDPTLYGSQPALLEQMVGSLFPFVGWHAPQVMMIFDSIVPVGIFLLLWLFFRRSGFSHLLSYGGGIAFILINFYGLGRPIHQGGSFLVLLATLNCLIAGLERRAAWGVAGGILLGCLFGIYFWSWSIAWAWWGVMVLAALAEFRWRRKRRVPTHDIYGTRLLVFGGIGLAATVPFALQLLRGMHGPLSAAAAFRSGMQFTHLPESIIYSTLFVIMAGSALLSIPWERTWPKHRYTVALIIAVAIAINQQVVHGVVLDFVSHYTMSMALAAICAVLLAFTIHSRWTVIAGLMACVYLAGLAYDGRYAVTLFRPVEARFAEQHLADAIDFLNDQSRVRILTDADTSLLIAASTPHDVVYSLYLQNTLMSNEELAERYCMTLLSVPPALRDIEHREPLIYPAADRAFNDDPTARRKEIQLVQDACARLDKDPAGALKKYGVDQILWNEVRELKWDLKRLKVSLTKAKSGSGWSLWALKASTP